MLTFHDQFIVNPALPIRKVATRHFPIAACTLLAAVHESGN